MTATTDLYVGFHDVRHNCMESIREVEGRDPQQLVSVYGILLECDMFDKITEHESLVRPH